MQKLRILIVGLLVSASMAIPLPAFAHVVDAEANSTTTAQPPTPSTTTSTTDSTSNSSKTTTDDAKTTLQDRITKLKADLKTKLTDAEQVRIKGRCVAAQKLVKNLDDGQNKVETTRNTDYQDIVTKLNDLVTKLKAANVSTTDLEAEITALNTKITTYKTDADTLNQTLSDLSSLDCASDPTAFKAALEGARTDIQKVHDDVVAIRTEINGTIKPTLNTIKAQLQKTESSSSDSSTGLTTGGN